MTVGESKGIEELFYGSVTVGERGQVVIPAEARRELNIDTGDKLLAFSHFEHTGEPVGIIFVKLDKVNTMIKEFSQFFERLELVEKEKSNKSE